MSEAAKKHPIEIIAGGVKYRVPKTKAQSIYEASQGLREQRGARRLERGL